ncbi:hypothetical protein SBI67_00510 [Mycolicibacterium sp. 120266]|uniref:hypothetical protein n=1 Tax=Mycolicibacterium sp. 120266 TaxID=3090601 RepID=UPI00299F3127|nr:hypothetical protein [Mycolicibacterium sp. 120266]MDX1870590.1 hypothetical protein [Mycolicibacterium sp. 120266]
MTSADGRNRTKTVKDRAPPVKKPSTPRLGSLDGSSFDLAADAGGLVFSERSDMSTVVYLALTVAIFALLGLVQKWVEGL